MTGSWSAGRKHAVDRQQEIWVCIGSLHTRGDRGLESSLAAVVGSGVVLCGLCMGLQKEMLHTYGDPLATGRLRPGRVGALVSMCGGCR